MSMNKDYFEAVIQLRNPNEEVLDFILDALGPDLTKIKKVRNGLDIYAKSNKGADRIVRNARDEFGGEYNVAPTLFSVDKQTSKELYRLSILLRLPGFQKKDVIKVDDKLIQVTGLGKKLSGTELKRGKKVVMKYPENFEVIPKHETRVVLTEPRVEVLHPETYQSEPLMNPDEKLKVEEKVTVVSDKGLWLVK